MFKNLAERPVHLVLEEFTPVGHLAKQVVKAGDYQHPDHGAEEHPAGSGGTDGSVADRTGTSREHQRE